MVLPFWCQLTQVVLELLLLLLLPLYGSLDFVPDYWGEQVPERLNQNQSGFPGAKDSE